MDHERLLAKYIQYIGEIEGTDYLGYDHGPPGFSKIEWDELRRLAAPLVMKMNEIEIKNAIQHFPECPFQIMRPSPCDPLYRLVSMKEEEDGVVTMVLERVEENDA